LLFTVALAVIYLTARSHERRQGQGWRTWKR